MLKRTLAMTTVGFAMLGAAAIAQTTAPSPAAPASPAPMTNAPATAPAPANTGANETNLAGQGKWRASKLMGVDIYGPDNAKVGDVTEVLFNKDGRIEMITVGVGGFLGIGSKDVAVPFDQVTWSDQPMQSTAAPAGGTGAGTASAPPAATTTTASAPAMYPDHGKISMTKEQLTSAPAVSYAAR